MLHDEMTGKEDWVKTAMTAVHGAIVGEDGKFDLLSDGVGKFLAVTMVAPVGLAWMAYDAFKSVQKAEKQELQSFSPDVIEQARAAARGNNAAYAEEDMGYARSTVQRQTAQGQYR